MNKSTLTRALSLASFASLAVLAACGGGDDTNSGGVGSEPLVWQFTQGQITDTDSPMDLAISGAGFFQLDNDKSPPMYTRRGRFHLDREGYIVNERQTRLLMRPANEQGVIQAGAAAVPTKLPSGYLAPVATTVLRMDMNLDARGFMTSSETNPTINFEDARTYHSATSVVVNDAKGLAITLTFYFQKTADNSWNVYATANGVTVAGDNAAPVAIAELRFHPNGAAPIQPTGHVIFDIPVTMTGDGDSTLAIAGLQLDLSNATQYGSGFGVWKFEQNGSQAGILTSLTFEPNGTLFGNYSNGRKIPFGQIELATFSNMQCLRSGGNNLWFAGPDCDPPLTGTPGSGFFNLLLPGALEAL